MAKSIPILDYRQLTSASPSDVAKFSEEAGKALTEVGFFALSHHGIPEEFTDRCYRHCHDLFALPEGDKKAYEIDELKGQRGYTSFGREHAKGSNHPDLKEFWHVGQEDPRAKGYAYPENIWPGHSQDFKPVMVELFRKLENLALDLLKACAIYIEEPEEIFCDIARNGNSILRLIHYPPLSPNIPKGCVRAAAHEDINLITLLVDATESGLEILSEGEWVPVVTPKGCIIVDSGDMLQNITNGLYKATTHRVVNPVNSNGSRYSMPFFVHAQSGAALDPLPSCLKKTGERKFPNITAGEFLSQRLREIGLDS